MRNLPSGQLVGYKKEGQATHSSIFVKLGIAKFTGSLPLSVHLCQLPLLQQVTLIGDISASTFIQDILLEGGGDWREQRTGVSVFSSLDNEG